MKKLKFALMTLMMILSIVPVMAFTSSAASVSIPKGATQYNGHTYYVFKSDVSWTKAKALCEKKGGHLVTITSAKENAYVYSLMKKQDVTYAFIGAKKTSNGSWAWVTGEKFKYANWDSGEPNNYYGDQKCIEMYYDGKWSDWSTEWYNTFDGAPGYVCEWDGTIKQMKSVRLNESSKTVTYGSSVTLKIWNTNKTAKWSTSNKKVATVSSKGKVTAKGIGSCTITAKVGSKTLKCKITVKDKDQKASLKFTASDGGYFIKNANTATVKFAPKSYNCGKATVYIKNSDGDTVFKKSVKNLTKGKAVYVTWDGKNTKGKYVPAGSYKAYVKIGNKATGSAYLTFYGKNEFAGGTGAKSNPFLVASASQLKKIVKYPEASFKQTKNLDFDYNAVGNFFTKDMPFNGRYNGNNKTIKNISANYALFEYVGEKGVIYNLKLNNCSVMANQQAILARYNYGKIKNCNVNGTITTTVDAEASVGFIAYQNFGTVTNCTASGSASATGTNYDWAYSGGLVGNNQSTGKVISCVSKVNTYTCCDYGGKSITGGIAYSNSGIINGCEAEGTIVATYTGYNNGLWAGGIVGSNNGHVSASYYTGASNVNIAGNNTGIVS